ncbi:hypothetical protein ABIC44_003591 [Sphingomonas sp. 1185]
MGEWGWWIVLIASVVPSPNPSRLREGSLSGFVERIALRKVRIPSRRREGTEGRAPDLSAKTALRGRRENFA